MKKKIEQSEKYSTQGIIQLNYNGQIKNIDYEISYLLKAMKIDLRCNRYQLKYIGKSIFKLNTPILFENEIIKFSIKNLTDSFDKSQNDIKIILKTFDDNTCSIPIKNIDKNSFSLKIQSDKINKENAFLSCSATVIICQRFQFVIRINSFVKPLDFDFLISHNEKKGFLNEQIYCFIEDKKEFDFILYIRTQQNRMCEVNFESDYDKDLLEIKELKSGYFFFNPMKIKIHIKFLKIKETNILLKAKIDEIIKKINIIFTSDEDLKNTNYKFPGNDFKNDESAFFYFSLNELSAHGKKIKEKQLP